MKFGKTYEEQVIPEWKSKYLDYEFLKGIIDKITAPVTPRGGPNLSSDITPLSEEETGFMTLLSYELKKVEEFYSTQLQEAANRKEVLLLQLYHMNRAFTNRPNSVTGSHNHPEIPPLGPPIASPPLPSNVKNKLSWSHASPSSSLLPLGIKSRIVPDNLNVPQQPGAFPMVGSGVASDPAEQRRKLQRKMSMKDNIVKYVVQKQSMLSKLQIEKACVELYHQLELLKSYRNLNKMAHNKIVKKFLKHTNLSHRVLMEEKLTHEFTRKSLFYTKYMDLEVLMKDIENLYQQYFSNGNKVKAIQSLRGTSEHHYPLIAFNKFIFPIYSSGFLTGINLMLFINIITFAFAEERPHRVIDGLFLIYLGLGFPLMLANLLSVNIFVWDQFKINFRMIFRITREMDSLDYSCFVSFLATVYLVFVFLSLTGKLDSFLPVWTQPWFIIGVLLAIVGNVFNIYDTNSRLWLGNVLWRIITIPYYPCEFKDFFIADQLVSIGPFYYAIAFLIYFSIQGGDLNVLAAKLPFAWYIVFLPIFPFYIRCLQCLRRYFDGASRTQLYNCGRYLLGITVLLMNGFLSAYPDLYKHPYLYAFFIVRFITTGFGVYWDIYNDWGLGGGRISYQPKENGTQLIAFPKSFYYFALVTNTIARFVWFPILLYAVMGGSPPLSTLSKFGIEIIEMVRRFQWNFIRVEMEHVNNCEGNRVVSDIALPFSARDLFISDGVDEAETEVSGHSDQRLQLQQNLYGNDLLEGEEDDSKEVETGPPSTNIRNHVVYEALSNDNNNNDPNNNDNTNRDNQTFVQPFQEV
jgi:hypothetical protein